MRKQGLKSVIAAALFPLVMFGQSLFATNFTVNDVADDIDVSPGDGICANSSGLCTLRAAVMEANALSGPDMILLSRNTTYTLAIAGSGENTSETGDLDVTDDLKIKGRGTKTVIDADFLDRVIHVLGADLILEQLKITNGYALGEDGGAILFDDTSSEKQLNMTKTTFINNECYSASTDCSGGAIAAFLDASSFVINASNFRFNSASGDDSYGGAVYAYAENSSVMTIDSSRFAANSLSPTSRAFGGAISVEFDSSDLAITSTTVTGNYIDSAGSYLFGGAFYADFGDSSLSLDGTSFKKNYITGGSPYMLGGGAYFSMDNSPMSVIASTFQGNTITGSASYEYCEGGGAYFSSYTSPSVSISQSTFRSNSLVDCGRLYGGGMYIESGVDPSEFTIESSTFSNNSLTDSTGATRYIFGAGLFSRLDDLDNPLYIINSTFSGNRSDDSGGGIFSNAFDPYIYITNSTITNNTAAVSGSGIYMGSSPTLNVYLKNSIIAGNVAAGTSDAELAVRDCLGELTSEGYNLIGQLDTVRYTDCVIAPAAGDQIGSITAPVNARLGSLRSNGGLTKTHALKTTWPASSAIDAGDPVGCTDPRDGSALSYDQRDAGYTRTVDGDADGTATCDIGAYEVQ
jgi:CSLREA domain-containing protein